MNRNRTLESNEPIGRTGIVTTVDYTNTTAWNSRSSTAVHNEQLTKVKDATINDYVLGYGEARVVNGQWQRLKLARRRRPLGPVLELHHLRPVYPCNHTKTEVRYSKHLATVHSLLLSEGNPIHERLMTRTANFDSAASLILDNSNVADPESFAFGASDPTNYSSDYRKHDWFNLMSRFNEACDQLIPSSLVVGEDIVENDVYKLAFKSVLNPSRAIGQFIRYVGKMPRRYRKGSLGHIVSKIRKDKVTVGEALGQTVNTVSSGHLFYNFAVKPAISTLEDSIRAHDVVSQKLNYLRRHGGQFVPVRVRTDLMSDIENNPLPSIDLDVETRFRWQISVKKTTAVIGAWGRVRRDIEWSDVWSAYLQFFGINKIVGLAWELIPYSFVVDWFTNAQERINELTRIEGPKPYTEFGRLWASEKKTLVEELYCIPGRSSVLTMPMTTPNAPFVVLNRETTEYSRFPRIPDSSGVVDLSNFTSFHATLLAALTGQLFTKRRR